MQGALERLLRLKTDDGLLVGVRVVDVARRMAADTGDRLGVHVEHATLLALLQQEIEDLAPQVFRALGRPGEEGVVALIRGVVLLDEVADVNLLLPGAALETVPCLLHSVTTLLVVTLCGPRNPCSAVELNRHGRWKRRRTA